MNKHNILYMTKKKDKIQKRNIELNVIQALLGVMLISIVTTLISIAIQPGAFSTSLMSILKRPLTIVLNGYPVLIFVLIGYFITNNIFWGAVAPSVVWLVFSYINLLKIEGREDVFVPSDIALFKEAMTAASDYSLNMHPKLIVLIAAYTILLFLAGFVVKSAKIKWTKRSVWIVLSLLSFVFSMKYVYSSDDLFYSYKLPETYNIPARFNALGFQYGFLHNYNLYPVDKPENYDRDVVKAWEEEYQKEKTEKAETPNVIMIMCEAFSDLANESVFDWQTEEENPIYKYNLLAQSEQAITGHIMVSNIAAGTANTEFDVLTGMPTTMIGEATTSAFRVVNRDINTVASIMVDNGYDATFIHPGDSWFYNRSNVYRHFGIENQIFEDRFDLENDMIGSYVSDQAFLRELKNEIEASDDPYFMYGVTIQNHQTYSYKKYEDLTKPIPVKVPLSDAAMEYASVYMRGAKDSADMLYDLTAYLDTLEEPTVLVFFGDHLPNLGAGYLAYKELGLTVGNMDTPENTLSGFQTPFLIYGNRAYAKENSMGQLEEALDLPVNHKISSIYLGAVVLEMLGYTGEDAYFDFLNEARRTLPVFREKEAAYMLPDGTYTNEISKDIYEDIIKKIDWWEYYRLKNH